ncbi:bifunctional diaminohydroxyphosphoribosylaminopyrimidine deaminase/5-amino-6-(5-phosphoribosylamino)uracil reductase RibD [Candidatus Woesearchaeota archaeon]|nr:bifunctional diaminohydroxyphosphoribosylaminopyrimidine deaminase/5-amino-6-(5-phosphoribosylamino)uracil reductase RibD [Candidatus Woesearchaeota archaeon]
MKSNEYCMRRAIKLANKARPSPNPKVGCVIVKNGTIIGEGFHKKAGMPHAEIEALRNTKSDVKGATLYVNLEPCCHYGKTPPCCDAIINAGIKKVVIATTDCNKQMCGKGISKLIKNRISVVVGVLGREAKELNEDFFKFIRTKRPFVLMKVAISKDGKITGRKHISCLESRKKAHRMRADADAIIVGINTIINDNPRLTTRLARGANPVRVALDSRLRIPQDSKVLNKDAITIIATTKLADKSRLRKLRQRGIEVIICGKKKVDLKELLKKLGEKDIMKLMVEGGKEVIDSFIRQKLIDKAVFFISPEKIKKGKNFSENGIVLKNATIKKTGKDIMVEGYPEWKTR